MGEKMLCPFCNSENIRVVETREASKGSTRRRRECIACNKRFTTYEYVGNQDIRVIKKNGSVEQFNRQKIIDGIWMACNKRPVTYEQVESIADEVEMEIFQNGKGEISTKKIGDMVMERLRDLDEVAYMRFASVYKAFKDVGQFKHELEILNKVGGKNGTD